MGMTIAEKALAKASGRASVSPGEYVDAKIDRMIVLEGFVRMHTEAVMAGFDKGIPRIWDRDRFHILVEHLQPPLNKTHAAREKKLRELAEYYELKHFRDVTCGVVHQIAMEDYILPGELALGNDSHSIAWGALNCVSTALGERELAYALCFGEIWFKVPETIKVVLEGKTPDWLFAKDVALYLAGKYTSSFALYKAVEYTGPAVEAMSIGSRHCLSTHTVELGGKFGLFPYDRTTEEFLSQRKGVQLHQLRPFTADPDATYCKEVRVDLGSLEPQVAQPHSFDNVVPVSKVAGIPIQQANLGSCANGHFEDLEAAARLLKGKKVHPKTRLLVQPASWQIYRECMKNGIIEDFLNAGAQVLAPGCHLCMGMQGVLPDGDNCISSTTRNFRGRLGSSESNVYLANPQTVVASAVAGHIIDHREVL